MCPASSILHLEKSIDSRTVAHVRLLYANSVNMEELAHLLLDITPALKVAIAIGAPTTLMAAGAVPRVGPLRALVLGLSSRLFLRANPVSQRTQEVTSLRSFLASKVRHKDLYSIVAGPKGVGKTCVVDTATAATFGVVSVGVAPGTLHNAILADVFTAITRCELRIMNLSASTRRVLWWHSLIFRTPVTVLLRGVERKPTETFAALDSAAKALAHDFGLRVVIDASDNSLPENAKKTMREEVVEVGPMSRAVLESVPDIAELLSALKAADLSDVVWECVGGVPARYIQLADAWKEAGRGVGIDLEAVVEPFLINLLKQAISDRRANVIANPRLEELYPLFLKQSEVPTQLLEQWKLDRPSPDKVLRVKDYPTGLSVIVPANAPTAVVLRFALQEAPRLQELKRMLRDTPPPTSSI